MKKILPILYLTLIFVQCKTAQPPVDTATATLENTYWKLAEMNGQPVITPADAREVHMILGPVETEKRIKGFAQIRSYRIVHHRQTGNCLLSKERFAFGC